MILIDRTAPTMRIRLHGTRAETAAVPAAIATVLRIRFVSRPYPDRQSPMFQRIYLDATPRRTPPK
ncbi:hypothetical protein [Plantactinospora sp. CA-290183]|uniref:hypothetical protein n=1 Tax=Plantactinospora sp. CA-290183 TaxID=3240006 RepID=UPI003D942279